MSEDDELIKLVLINENIITNIVIGAENQNNSLDEIIIMKNIIILSRIII